KAEEAALAKKQFEAIEKLSTPGEFITVRRLDDLIAKLQRALRPELKWSLEDSAGPVKQASGKALRIRGLEENFEWVKDLKPDLYTLRVYGREQRIQIEPGDRMLVLMTNDGFKREMWRDYGQNREKPTKKDAENWSLTAFQHQLKDNQAQNLL